jgi:hypothetical protein
LACTSQDSNMVVDCAYHYQLQCGQFFQAISANRVRTL